MIVHIAVCDFVIACRKTARYVRVKCTLKKRRGLRFAGLYPQRASKGYTRCVRVKCVLARRRRTCCALRRAIPQRAPQDRLCARIKFALCIKDARSHCMPKDNVWSCRTLFKGGATIGAVHRGRYARFEPRAADEACTARVNANKF